MADSLFKNMYFHNENEVQFKKKYWLLYIFYTKCLSAEMWKSSHYLQTIFGVFLFIQVVGSCEQNNEPLGFHKRLEIPWLVK